jgi:endoglucanase Acf2
VYVCIYIVSDALLKSISTKSLTEFREFKLNSSRTTRRNDTHATGTTNIGKENTANTHSRIQTPMKLSVNNTAATSTLLKPASITSELSISVPQESSAVTATPVKRKVVPPVPLFAEAQRSVSVAIGTANISSATTVAPLVTSSSSISLDAPSDEFDEDGFAVDTVSIADILNDDAWKEDEEPPVPLPLSSSSVCTGIPSSLFSTSAPITPLRRTTLNGCASIATPRTTARGSIYGGALRTPVSNKHMHMHSLLL